MQTLSKVVAAFNVNHKKTLETKDATGSVQCDPSYPRVLCSIIENLNRNENENCTHAQRNLIIEGLAFICENKILDSLGDIYHSLEEILTFLVASLDAFLVDYETAEANELNLKTIIHLVCVLSPKFEENLHVAGESQSWLEKLFDKVMLFVSVHQQELKQVQGGAKEDMKLLKENIHQSQLVCQVFVLFLKHEKRAKIKCSQHLNIASAISTFLVNRRVEIKAFVKSALITSRHVELFRDSTLVSSMVRYCDLEEFIQCSHILKIFVIFGENPRLSDIIVENFSVDFITIFMAAMRSEDSSVEVALTKFWLVKNLCNNASYKVLAFLAEGGMLAILTVLRSVDVDDVGGLSLVSPFRESLSLLDLYLTNAQLIQHFGILFQCERSPLIRQQAFAVLQTFAQGLDLPAEQLSSSIATSFIESGILFGLVNAIGNEDDEDSGNNDAAFSCQDMGTSLLCVLLKDPSIREAFLAEPLGILQCLSASRDQFCSRCSVTMSLVTVLESLITYKEAQVQLFECNVVNNLENFIKDVLSSDEEGIAVEVRGDLIRRCLNIFAVMASSNKSRDFLNAMNFADFLRLLLLHDDKDIVTLVSDILYELEYQPSPEKWKDLFNLVKDSWTRGNGLK